MKNKKDYAISVRGISKTFKIPLGGRNSLKQKILGMFKKSAGYRNFTPLSDVSFEIKKGDFFGILGKNGSGKSTLLKTMAGIYSPEKGAVTINGILVPFIELGVGFNPELTGRENIYLNAAMLGFSRKETTAMYNEIVDFAELGDFMEERLKNYSSGMQVRLAFSIAIQAKGDILLLDEVLAVGDAAFQQKCFDYFEKIRSEHKTVILVTHSMEAVKRFCNKALLLENGSIKMIGKAQDVADQYLLDNIQKSIENNEDSLVDGIVKNLHSVINKNEYERTDTLSLQYEYSLNKETDTVLALSIVKDGKSIAEMNSMSIQVPSTVSVANKATINIPLSSFNPGEYSVNISLFSRNTMKMLDYKIKSHTFVIKGNDQSRGGALYLDGVWSVD